MTWENSPALLLPGFRGSWWLLEVGGGGDFIQYKHYWLCTDAPIRKPSLRPLWATLTYLTHSVKVAVPCKRISLVHLSERGQGLSPNSHCHAHVLASPTLGLSAIIWLVYPSPEATPFLLNVSPKCLRHPTHSSSKSPPRYTRLQIFQLPPRPSML